MPGINADDRQPDPFQLVPEPAGHGTSLKSNALGVRRPFAQQLRQGSRIGLGLSLEQRLSSIVDHANARLLLRHIQSDILLHRGLLISMVGGFCRQPSLRSKERRQQLRHRVQN